MAANVKTVFDAIVACGVDNATRFNGDTATERIATEIFDNDFMSYIDKDVSVLEVDFKTYSGLTVNQGQIRLHPATKRHIKAFIQWTKDENRTGLNPSLTEFPIVETANLIRRHNTWHSVKNRSGSLTRRSLQSWRKRRSGPIGAQYSSTSRSLYLVDMVSH